MFVRILSFIIVFFFPSLSIMLSQGTTGRGLYINLISWSIAIWLFFELSVIGAVSLYLFVVFHALYIVIFSKRNCTSIEVKGSNLKVKFLVPIVILFIISTAGVMTFESRLKLEQSTSLDYEAVSKGRELFKACQACHRTTSQDNDFVGPHLVEIVGRKAGSLTGYTYSESLKQADFVWEDKNLVQFLQNPREFLPGTRMATGKLTKEDALNIVIYLKSK